MSASASQSHTPPSLVAARTLVAALVAHGMRDVVLAPGSRSAPLAYAFAEAADGGAVRLHVRIDERAAGFLALGLARGQEVGRVRPVGIVTTSGTAVANLHPAVLEAHHGQVPLIVLTADRPHELRGTGANQTTDQVEIFGSAVRFAADVPAPAGLPHEDGQMRALAARAVVAACGIRSGNPGPTQLNVSFRDPLAPQRLPSDAECAKTAAVPAEQPALFAHSAGTGTEGGGGGASSASVPVPAGRTVVVAGDGAGTTARSLAEARGWPLLAESVSGAAGGPNLVAAHAQVLTHAPIAREIEHVVVLGRPTLSRPVQQLLARTDVEVTVITPGAAQWPDPAGNAAVVLPAIPQNWLTHQPPPTESHADRLAHWCADWRTAGQLAHAAITQEFVSESLSGPRLAHELAATLTGSDTLVVGSSNPVRDLDLVAAWTEPPRVVANRGLAGIDGLVSTATGVALAQEPAREPERVVRALMGDLTFLHDVGGLLRAPTEPEPHLQIVVANDRGGSIFASLEHGALAGESPERGATFERVFATPHTADLEALCRGYRVRHTRVTDLAGLRSVLAEPGTGLSVVEVVLDRSSRRADGASRSARVARALGGAS